MSRRLALLGLAAALAACAEGAQTAGRAAPEVAGTAGAAALIGTWTGVWDDDPRFTTSLVIDRVTEAGEVEGSYIFQRQRPFPFTTRLDGRSFRFEARNHPADVAAMVFTFTLRPDGRMTGSRQWRSGVNQTVLTRSGSR